jgi:hypothetical protein
LCDCKFDVSATSQNRYHSAKVIQSGNGVP